MVSFSISRRSINGLICLVSVAALESSRMFGGIRAEFSSLPNQFSELSYPETLQSQEVVRNDNVREKIVEYFIKCEDTRFILQVITISINQINHM